MINFEILTFFINVLLLLCVIFAGFFVLAGFALKHVYERRLRARLQDELNHLFLDYIPLDGEEIETITFNSDRNVSSNTRNPVHDRGPVVV